MDSMISLYAFVKGFCPRRGIDPEGRLEDLPAAVVDSDGFCPAVRGKIGGHEVLIELLGKLIRFKSSLVAFHRPSPTGRFFQNGCPSLLTARMNLLRSRS